jgi:hypothetical protein
MMTETHNRNAVFTTVSAPEGAEAPEWIVEMRAYRGATGLYRAEDLNRGLGDPRVQVRGEIAADLLLASSTKNAS